MSKKHLKRIFEIYKIPAYKNQIVYYNQTKEEFDNRVRKALSFLKQMYKEILINTYLGDNKFWWVDYYSKSSYYQNLFYSRNAFIAIFLKL